MNWSPQGSFPQKKPALLRGVAWALLLFGLGLGVTGRAAELAQLPEPWREVGAGRFVWLKLVPVYETRLATQGSGVGPLLLSGDRPLKLEFLYRRQISGDDLRRSGEVWLEKNLTADERARIAERVNTLQAAFRTVQDGDRYTLVYEPGVGTSLLDNGERRVTVPGADFPGLYFQIWLGERPVSAPLRDQLLGLD